MMRRASKLAALVLVTGAPGVLRAQVRTAVRPNVVFILSDDHRWDALGAAGNTRIKTPTLDRLAREGTYFRQATVFVSQCTPSRAVLMTGLPPHANGFYSLAAQRRDLWWQDSLSIPTLPSLLRDAGYRTVLVGKWHLTPDPWKSGFVDVRTWVKSAVAAYRDPSLPRGNTRDGSRREGFTNEIFADDAIAFLQSDEAKEKPFLLWLALTAPHTPTQPNPDRVTSLYEGKTTADLLPPAFPPTATPNDFEHYSHAVSLVDDLTGRVVAALEAKGLADNTVVVFMGDNGHMMGSRGISNKIVPYDESTRVPLIVRVPGARARGTSDAAVSSLDLPPTLLRLAGITPRANWPGRDMSALLRTGDDAGFGHAFGEWSDNVSFYSEFAHRLVRTPELKLIRWERAGMPEEMYDLRRDPHETKNVAREPAYQKRRQRLVALLANWQQSTGDPARTWPAGGVRQGGVPALYPTVDEARAREVRVERRVLDEYAGRYEMVDRVVITIARRDDGLTLSNAAHELVALSQTEFLQASGPMQFRPWSITFERDSVGRVTGGTIRERGYKHPVRRIASSPVRAEANDNRLSAGVLRDGVLSLHLLAQRVTWHPEADDGPSKVVEAFGEAGQAPRVPGPLIRIPLGTTVDATITNALADTLVVLGLRGRADSLRIAPNDTRQVRYTPRAAGSFLYAAGEGRDGKIRFGGTHGQLVGALIVGAGAPPKDRIFIATSWDPVPIAGNPYFLAMNGKSWPYTEKFVHTVGDTVRWRVLNGSSGTSAHHPMHLHGFYYRVDARGGWDADTVYRTAQQRWVVTENLPEFASMSMTWVPSRPGNWLFHCHNADHVAGRHRHMIAGRESPYPAPPLHNQQEHLAWDMAGLANAITIVPRVGETVAETSRPSPRAPTARALRLLVQARPRFYGPGPGFGYVLQDGATEPAPDSINVPGPQLVLRRDEPVEITVVNRLTTHTTVHWHGIELESFYDGIAGWSGSGDNLAPMLAPGDSFIVRFAPPRAGTFIYHAHVSDHVQLARGLYGALVVVAPGRPSAPGTDHVAIVGLGRPNGRPGLLLNGSVSPTALERRRQGPQRVRVINISPENTVIFTLSADSMPIHWRAIAKDGFDLPTTQRRMLPARVQVFPGETYDFEFESAADVVHLRMKNPATGPGVDDITLPLRAPPRAPSRSARP